MLRQTTVRTILTALVMCCLVGGLALPARAAGILSGAAPDPAYPNFQLWFDANDPASLSLSGSNVLQWNDKAGAASNAAQGTAIRQPALATGLAEIGGLSAVRFDWSTTADAKYLSGNVSLAANKTIFFVARDSGTVSAIGGVFVQDSSYNGVFSDTGARYVADWGGSSAGASANTVSPINTFSVISAKYDNANGTITMFQNGVGAEVYPATKGAAANSASFWLGARRVEYDRWFKGDLAEILVYDKTLTGNEEAQVGQYLAGKYALSYAAPAAPTAYSQKVLQHGAVGYYRMEQNDNGVALDSAGNDIAQHGNFVGTTSLSTDTPGNLGGKSVTLNGAGYVDIPAVADMNFSGGTYGQPFTLESWVKKSADFGGSYLRIIDKTQAGTGNGFGFDMTDTQLRLLGSANAGAAYTSTGNTGDWIHLVAVSDGAGTAKFYVNGQFVGAGAYASPNAWAGNLRVGADSNGGSLFNGKADESAVYNVALSAAQIREHYAAAAPIVQGDGTLNPARPNLKLWFDASDSGTITLNGSAVAQWNDKSASPQNAAQADPAKQPVLTPAAVNGKSVVTFDGADDFLSGSVACDGSKTFFIVAKDNGTTNGYGAAINTTGGNHNGVYSENGLRWVDDYAGAFSGNSANTNNPINAYQIILAKYDNVNGTISMFQEGVPSEVYVGSTGAAGSGTFYLGTRNNELSRYLKGGVAEIMMYEGILTGQDEVAVGKYLAAKYNLPFALSFDTTSAYARRVLADGAIALHRMEANTGNVSMDAVGDDVAQNGAFAGTYSLASSAPGTIGGKSADLASTGYVDLGAARDMNFDGGVNGRPFTLEAWTAKDAAFGGSLLRIIDKTQAGTGNGYGFDMSDTQIRMLGATNLTLNAATGGVGQWTQVVATSDGAGLGRIYVNGRLVGQGAYASQNAWNGSLRIGADSNASNKFNGKIDEAAVYGSALTPSTVLKHYYQAFTEANQGQVQSFRRGENGYAGMIDARLVGGAWADMNFGSAQPDILGAGNIYDAGERGLMRFDLSSLRGLALAGNDGTLMMTVVSNESFTGRTIGLYAVSSANGGWIEGVHGSLNPGVSPGEPTWNSHDHPNPWVGGPGGGSLALLDSFTYNGEPIVYFNIPRELLNAWILSDSANAGLVLADVNEDPTSYHRLFFAPSDYAVMESRPLLVFDTIVPEPATLLALLIGLPALAGRLRRRMK